MADGCISHVNITYLRTMELIKSETSIQEHFYLAGRPEVFLRAFSDRNVQNQSGKHSKR